MRHPKLCIFRSKAGTHTHYLYRFKNDSTDYPIEHLINEVEPIAVILESSTPHVEKKIENHLMSREMHPKNNEGYVAFSTSFDFTYSNSVIKVNLKNDLTAKAFSYMKVYLGGKVITKIEFYEADEMVNIITDPDRVNTIIKILNSNSLLIQEDYVNYDIITFDMTVRVIEYSDIGSQGFEAAHGVYDAELKYIETMDYISFYQDASTKKNKYRYRIISKSAKGEISNMSKAVVCEVYEDAENVTTMLECSDNFRESGNPTWKHIDSKPNSVDIRVLKKNNNMASEIINVMNAGDLHSDDSLVASDGVRRVKITNIWHKENRKRMLRDKKVFRARNRRLNFTTNYSEPIVIEGQIEVLIDKMVILKKNVTSLPQAEKNKPIALNDPKASTLKIYVRQGGIYFKDFFMNDFESNENEFKDKPVSAVTLDSRFPLLDIKDSCIYSNIYNYTVYLYDETGKVSMPIVSVM